MKEVSIIFIKDLTSPVEDWINVGIFRINDQNVLLEILPEAYEYCILYEEKLLIPILEGIKKEIITQDLLREHLNKHYKQPMSSLQYLIINE